MPEKRNRISGSVFFKTAEEIEKIVEVCTEKQNRNKWKCILKTAEEIEKIVEICKKNK